MNYEYNCHFDCKCGSIDIMGDNCGCAEFGPWSVQNSFPQACRDVMYEKPFYSRYWVGSP